MSEPAISSGGEEYGTSCPCTNGCCDAPDVETPEHECADDGCSDCYLKECLNCGDECRCSE